MRFSEIKQDKGVAGLSILLSLVVMLFTIGLIVMIFTLMGNEMRDATYDSTNVSVVNETGVYINATGYTLDGASARDFSGVAIQVISNNTENVQTTNYTVSSAGVITNATAIAGFSGNYLWNVTYSYTWNADNTATDVMNDTVGGISNVTDWFSIFIVIGAMVVLILLTVIIITAIRGSGMIQGGSTPTGNQNVGYA